MPSSYIHDIAGLTNDVTNRRTGWAACDSNGDLIYGIEASGSGTLDTGAFYYTAVQIK